MSRELKSILINGEVPEIIVVQNPAVSTTESLTPRSYVDEPVKHTYQPQTTAPVHAEGSVFYSEKHKTLALQVDNPEAEILYGRETLFRVYNTTGSTIPNGSTLRYSGSVHAVGTAYIPGVELAQADTLDNAMCVFVATTEIGVDSVGEACRCGEVHDIDTSSFLEGQTLYLSADTAGGISNTPPPIRSVIGVCIRSHATEGVIMVTPIPWQTVPATLSMLEGLTQVQHQNITLTPTNLDLVVWDSVDEFISSADETAGTITLAKTGKHRVTMTFSFTFVESVTVARVIVMEFVDSSDTVVASTDISVAKTTTSASRSMSKIFDGVSGEDYNIRIRSGTTDNFATFNFTVAYIDVVSI